MSYVIDVLAAVLILAALVITCAALSTGPPREHRHRGHGHGHGHGHGRNRPA